MTPLPLLPLPTLEQARHWMDDLTTEQLSEADLQTIVSGENRAQARICRDCADPAGRPEDLVEALYRRYARAVAARGVPLGTVNSEAWGPSRLLAFDGEIERLEGPARKFVFG